jgi:peptidoglycan/LPS O-acetylase OafA/YrhL
VESVNCHHPLSAVQSTQSGVQRLSELDALRGIAALSVVLWHFLCATYTSLPAPQVIYWISRGDGAVVLFFLLSGFVLSLPFQRGQKPTYLAFAIRRLCRIYLPYLAGIGLSILVITFVAVSKIPELSAWFNQSCGVPFNGRIALEHLLLIGNFTLHIASLFIIGILLARYRETLVRGYRRIPAGAKWAALVCAMVLYRASMESPIVLLRDYGCALAGAAFIVFALGSARISGVLRKPVFTFLGNVSYAVYLNHLSVIFLLAFLCYPVLPLWLLCFAIVATTLLISFPFWTYIERPSISLGRYLVQRMAKASVPA